MKIGFHYHGFSDAYHPATGELKLSNDANSPDGHRYGRPLFMYEILKRGHDLVVLNKQLREKRRFGYWISPGVSGQNVGYGREAKYHIKALKEDVPNLDVIFMEWRWPTWKNDKTHPDHQPEKYEPDLDRQREIIEKYIGEIPIILWDTDLKIKPEDEKAYSKAIIADPSFKTNKLTRNRVSIPFWTDWKQILPVTEHFPVYGYIGNNYERPEEFKKYYFHASQNTRLFGVQTMLFGNWLQKSPEREDPSSLISQYRQTTFGYRTGWSDSMKIMNRFLCTTHISKPLYYETEFMSPRYLEALAVGCPSFQPVAFKQILLGKKWIAKDAMDIIDFIGKNSHMTISERQEIIDEQRDNLQKIGKFDVSYVVDFIESVI